MKRREDRVRVKSMDFRAWIFFLSKRKTDLTEHIFKVCTSQTFQGMFGPFSGTLRVILFSLSG